MFQVRITKINTKTHRWLEDLMGNVCKFDTELHAVNAINAVIEFYDIVGNDELHFQVIDMITNKPQGLPYE